MFYPILAVQHANKICSDLCSSNSFASWGIKMSVSFYNFFFLYVRHISFGHGETKTYVDFQFELFNRHFILIKINETTPQIMISDPTRVRQILINLVQNAIKFTQFGSVIIKSYGCKKIITKSKSYKPC